MINEIKLFINRYKVQIIGIIGLLVLGLIIAIVLNTLGKRQDISDISLDSSYSIDYGNDRTIIDNKKENTGKYVLSKTLIQDFITNCKENPLKAYQMLSDESLEKYDTYDKFKNEYLQYKFQTKMTPNIKSYLGNTYLVELREDIMATGVINDTYTQDYITVNDKKINIDGIVSSNLVDTYAEFSNICITIQKVVYCVDEAYIDLKIHNFTNSDLNLDSSKGKIGISVFNSKNLQFEYINSYNSKNDLLFEPYEEKQIQIKVPYVLDDDVTINKISFDYVQLGDGKIDGKIISF